MATGLWAPRTAESVRDRIIDKLVNGPTGQAMLAEDAAEIAARRKAAGDAHAKAERDLLAALPKLDAPIAKAAVQVKAAEEALVAAQELHREAYAARQTAIWRHDEAQRRELLTLRELASDELIEPFRNWLLNAWLVTESRDELIAQFVRKRVGPEPAEQYRHLAFGGTAPTPEFSAWAAKREAAIHELQRLMGEARSELDSVGFLSRNSDSMSQRIAELRAQLAGEASP